MTKPVLDCGVKNVCVCGGRCAQRRGVFNVAPARTGFGGYLGEPQGPTFLPGGSDVPRLKRKEEYLSDPHELDITGRPEQRWHDTNEGSLPVRQQPSDFIHLSARDDFFRRMHEIDRGTDPEFEAARQALSAITDPETLNPKFRDEWDQAFAKLRPSGPGKLSSPVVRLENDADEKKYLYAPPPIEIMGVPLSVQHPRILGHADYGALATYSPLVRTHKD